MGWLDKSASSTPSGACHSNPLLFLVSTPWQSGIYATVITEPVKIAKTLASVGVRRRQKNLDVLLLYSGDTVIPPSLNRHIAIEVPCYKHSAT